MKRILGLIFVGIACVAAFLSVRGTLPFMPIYGTSMEPALHTGYLLMIEPVSARDVQVGDIIVFNVAPGIRDYYNYPPVVAHRVIRVISDFRGLTFRTKGDNTGEDPFTVFTWDIRGKVGKQIPYLGFPLLFMQSKQGLIFVVVALSLLAFFLYSYELGLAGRKAQRGVFAPVIEEAHRNNQVLTHKIDTTEKKMDTTQQALEKFAAAIDLYAQHLASHTSAIQGLSQASQELSKSAADQNKVLAHLMRTIEQPKPTSEETVSDIEKAINELQKVTPVAAEKKEKKPKKQYPPGCVRSRQELARLNWTDRKNVN